MSNSIFLEAFLDGATGGGLSGKLRRPGAPTELIDSRTVEEFLGLGAFERILSRCKTHISGRPARPKDKGGHGE